MMLQTGKETLIEIMKGQVSRETVRGGTNNFILGSITFPDIKLIVDPRLESDFEKQLLKTIDDHRVGPLQGIGAELYMSGQGILYQKEN